MMPYKNVVYRIAESFRGREFLQILQIGGFSANNLGGHSQSLAGFQYFARILFAKSYLLSNLQKYYPTKIPTKQY